MSGLSLFQNEIMPLDSCMFFMNVKNVKPYYGRLMETVVFFVVMGLKNALLFNRGESVVEYLFAKQ